MWAWVGIWLWSWLIAMYSPNAMPHSE
ncbi:hypothetical protein MESS2_1380021 [Mesorhizobium metallidurans STM 2683]|uniref:Uncharacterized protein n=1 Tax=Mesorhizobium metallidurans STM 2683 TaxID=1297569 RepID=M5EZ18_9HYPH|nr:hypothetical protein MESS2_1380021 [Mesorhizobium metallidurans STM 2683]